MKITAITTSPDVTGTMSPNPIVVTISAAKYTEMSHWLTSCPGPMFMSLAAVAGI